MVLEKRRCVSVFVMCCVDVLAIEQDRVRGGEQRLRLGTLRHNENGKKNHYHI